MAQQRSQIPAVLAASQAPALQVLDEVRQHMVVSDLHDQYRDSLLHQICTTQGIEHEIQSVYRKEDSQRHSTVLAAISEDHQFRDAGYTLLQTLQIEYQSLIGSVRELVTNLGKERQRWEEDRQWRAEDRQRWEEDRQRWEEDRQRRAEDRQQWEQHVQWLEENLKRQEVDRRLWEEKQEQDRKRQEEKQEKWQRDVLEALGRKS